MEKARTYYGGLYSFPVELRADAKIPWDKVQPLLALLRSMEYTRLSILTRDDEGDPSFVEALIDAPPTNTQLRIVCSDGNAMLNGRLCTDAELRTLLMKLGSFDRYSPVGIACGPNSSVQNVVEIIGMCNENLDRDAVHLVDDTVMETNVDGKQNAAWLKTLDVK